ncbi:MAG TPA: AIM24 family protein [Solirubrobacterales bacterium]|nr:AIM24 family protein [Solirubrobacterales bacterium]
MAVEQTLAQFRETETGEPFSLQNSKLLKVELADVTIQAKLGSMIAYQGNVSFEHAGSGGVSRMIKKAVTSEGTDLMKVSGTGEVFLAQMAQDVHLLKLEDDFITANGANVLAFDAGIDWDIKRVEGASGMLGGGLFNMELRGSGWLALVSDGPPVLLEVDGEQTFADPHAAITWSSGLTTSVKADVNLKTLVGRGSGETLQVAFSGQGWVLVQPSEGPVAGATASGGGSSGGQGGIGGALGGVLGR